MMKGFSVIDNLTGKEPDMEKIALEEKWANQLVYSSMAGFAWAQDGYLILLDSCGNYTDCPQNRFSVKP